MAPDVVSLVRIEVTADELRTLDDEGLCRRCVEPALAQVRGQPLAARLRVYQALSPAHRALLGFWVLYGHSAEGWTGLRAQLSELWGHEAFWSSLESSARHLEMTELLESMGHAKAACAVSTDPEALRELDASLLAWRPAGLAVAASYVRRHVDDFVLIRH